MADGNIWAQVLERVRADLDSEEFRRWFSNTSYASDSGDQVTVWVPSAGEARHLSQNYLERLGREFARLGRGGTIIRFVATGYADDEDDDEDDERG